MHEPAITVLQKPEINFHDITTDVVNEYRLYLDEWWGKRPTTKQIKDMSYKTFKAYYTEVEKELVDINKTLICILNKTVAYNVFESRLYTNRFMGWLNKLTDMFYYLHALQLNISLLFDDERHDESGVSVHQLIKLSDERFHDVRLILDEGALE